MDSSAAAAGVLLSRQKNCNNCVQVKRRCDRKTPVCSRCAEKNISCIYSKTKAVRQLDKPSIEPMPYAEAISFGSPGYPLFGVDPQTGRAASEYTPQSVLEASGGGDILMDPFLDLIGNTGSPLSDQWPVPVDESLFARRPNTPADDEIVRAYGKMAGLCDKIEPWHLYDPTTPLHWIVSRVKGFVTDMATHNATPFLHRRLYQRWAPPCILSCFATSVLYASRTPANAAMVMRTLHGGARELVDAEAGRATGVSPLEKLARVHALFLYQVVRLFDGDISLRAQAERDMPLFHAWLADLCRIRENLEDVARLGDAAARKQPPKGWEKWIFAESVRRTIIMAYAVIFLYGMVKDPEGRYCRTSQGSSHTCEPQTHADVAENLDPWAYVHRWTLSRPLWEAGSEFEFSRRWRETPHFVITNFSLENFLEHGGGEEVDDFAEILLGVYLGVDAMKEFVSGRTTQNIT
ncbi:hypothetical protein GGS23DRAFT_249423 [Durotheca rogersii]|uniref:uncharacterized protein n=1 Tax=Durotheca rogersii TaxID=419775 RepID=UPI0022205514|nr:uncharacterized protein GGS23DRAFT_249423 [Durotheca rogersii]KAI5860106.1 hypothetical protein GGS23DRAFT_249423 [Durotheca rogersii]